MPRDADHQLHVDDATNDLVSTMTPPDRSVYPRDNVDHIQQSPRTGEMNSADFDGQRRVDPDPATTSATWSRQADRSRPTRRRRHTLMHQSKIRKFFWRRTPRAETSVLLPKANSWLYIGLRPRLSLSTKFNKKAVLSQR